MGAGRKSRLFLLQQTARSRGTVASYLTQRGAPMMDVLMLTIAFGLFALAIGYAYACERL
jgi:hypothetical protein